MQKKVLWAIRCPICHQRAFSLWKKFRINIHSFKVCECCGAELELHKRSKLLVVIVGGLLGSLVPFIAIFIISPYIPGWASIALIVFVLSSGLIIRVLSPLVQVIDHDGEGIFRRLKSGIMSKFKKSHIN